MRRLYFLDMLLRAVGPTSQRRKRIFEMVKALGAGVSSAYSTTELVTVVVAGRLAFACWITSTTEATLASNSETKSSVASFWTGLKRFFWRQNDTRADWQWWLGFFLALSAIFLVVYSWLYGGVRVAAAALLIAAGAGAVGVMLGFLFGIPRSLQREEISQSSVEPSQSIRINTNLEQISDWLTKIIVGVGLTQAHDIFQFVSSAADKIGGLVSATNQEASGGPPLVLVIMVLFSILGFLQGYLWARIYLQEDFTNIEQKARRTPEYFEGLMNSYLYMPPPRGFTEALKLRDQYKEGFGDSLTSRMWTYLVSALGQQYAWKIEEEGKQSSDLSQEKEEFVRALKRALREDPEALELLRLQVSINRDLRSFLNDRDVLDLLGI
jgi:hypothetical protein